MVVAVGEEAEDGSTQVFYHSNADYVDDDCWELMSLAERRAASKPITQLLTTEIEQAIELGTFDARVGRHLSRAPLVGRRAALARVDDAALQGVSSFDRAIQAESAERLQHSRRRGIFGSSMQVLFEIAKPPY